jgi:hypothetical protein
VLTTAINNAAGRALDFISPGSSWLARACVPSALAVARPEASMPGRWLGGRCQWKV